MNASLLAVRERHLLAFWDQYLESDRLHQLDKFLARALKQLRSAGKQDRLWYGDQLFAMMRFAWLAVCLERAEQASVPPGQLGAWLSTAPSAEWNASALDTLRGVGGVRLWHWVAQRTGLRPAGPLIEALRQSAFQDACLPASLVWSGLAPHWQEPLQQRAALSGWSAVEYDRFIRQHASRPPVYLRVAEAHRATVLEELQHVGLQTSTHGSAIAVTGQKGLYELSGWKSGHFEIQDLASQAVGWAVNAVAGEFGWDACAGGGGKSLQLAAQMRGRGAVYASDIRSYKLEELKRRAKRASLHNIRTFPWQGDPLDRLPADVAKRGGFDWVLVDAPCTSSGTWRRNPDARWRCTATELDAIVPLQRQLLDAASGSVRPGGRLIYSTCSVLPDENEAIVEHFLAHHPGFQQVTHGIHGNPHENSDTLFSACLVRSPA